MKTSHLIILAHFIASLLATSCSSGQATAPGTAAPVTLPANQPILVKPTEVKPNLPSVTTPQLTAKRAVVIDAITGRILYQKNARTPCAVASTQKLLTALCVARAGSLEDPVTVIEADTNVVPSKLYIRAGEQYTRRQLVKGLLVKSGNDLAKALARDVSGSEAAFVALMNRTAANIGMTQSHFKNPHGLTEEGQQSTALDIAILAREVNKIPFYRECMQTKEYVFQYPGDRGTKTLYNTNKVLSKLPYCTGMKTGTTRASGRCLVSSGTLNGKSVIAVALGSTGEEIWNDSEKLLKWALE